MISKIELREIESFEVDIIDMNSLEPALEDLNFLSLVKCGAVTGYYNVGIFKYEKYALSANLILT